MNLQVVKPLHAPDKDVVAKLEDLLNRAKSGELKALAYVVVEVEGQVGTGWVQVADFSGYYHLLNSGCASLATRIAGAE